jgi:hypothetical protein
MDLVPIAKPITAAATANTNHPMTAAPRCSELHRPACAARFHRFCACGSAGPRPGCLPLSSLSGPRVLLSPPAALARTMSRSRGSTAKTPATLCCGRAVGLFTNIRAMLHFDCPAAWRCRQGKRASRATPPTPRRGAVAVVGRSRPYEGFCLLDRNADCHVCLPPIGSHPSWRRSTHVNESSADQLGRLPVCQVQSTTAPPVKLISLAVMVRAQSDAAKAAILATSS